MRNEASKKMKEQFKPGGNKQSKPTPKPAPKPAPKPPAPKPTPAPAPAVPIITTAPMDRATMISMLAAVAAAVPGTSAYRIIGGVAAAMFGSKRGTKDLDIIVPNRTIMNNVVDALVASGKFGVLKRASGQHQVWFKASNGKNYNADIFPPNSVHSTLQYPSSLMSSGATATGGAAVVGCAQLLNLKIFAYVVRKKNSDAEDILYLVNYMARKKLKTSEKEVYYSDDDFLLNFVTTKYASSKNDWIAIGLPPP